MNKQFHFFQKISCAICSQISSKLDEFYSLSNCGHIFCSDCVPHIPNDSVCGFNSCPRLLLQENKHNRTKYVKSESEKLVERILSKRKKCGCQKKSEQNVCLIKNCKDFLKIYCFDCKWNLKFTEETLCSEIASSFAQRNNFSLDEPSHQREDECDMFTRVCLKNFLELAILDFGDGEALLNELEKKLGKESIQSNFCSRFKNYFQTEKKCRIELFENYFLFDYSDIQIREISLKNIFFNRERIFLTSKTFQEFETFLKELVLVAEEGKSQYNSDSENIEALIDKLETKLTEKRIKSDFCEQAKNFFLFEKAQKNVIFQQFLRNDFSDSDMNTIFEKTFVEKEDFTFLRNTNIQNFKIFIKNLIKVVDKNESRDFLGFKNRKWLLAELGKELSHRNFKADFCLKVEKFLQAEETQRIGLWEDCLKIDSNNKIIKEKSLGNSILTNAKTIMSKSFKEIEECLIELKYAFDKNKSLELQEMIANDILRLMNADQQLHPLQKEETISYSDEEVKALYSPEKGQTNNIPAKSSPNEIPQLVEKLAEIPLENKTTSCQIFAAENKSLASTTGENNNSETNGKQQCSEFGEIKILPTKNKKLCSTICENKNSPTEDKQVNPKNSENEILSTENKPLFLSICENENFRTYEKQLCSTITEKEIPPTEFKKLSFAICENENLPKKLKKNNNNTKESRVSDKSIDNPNTSKFKSNTDEPVIKENGQSDENPLENVLIKKMKEMSESIIGKMNERFHQMESKIDSLENMIISNTKMIKLIADGTICKNTQSNSSLSIQKVPIGENEDKMFCSNCVPDTSQTSNSEIDESSISHKTTKSYSNLNPIQSIQLPNDVSLTHKINIDAEISKLENTNFDLLSFCNASSLFKDQDKLFISSFLANEFSSAKLLFDSMVHEICNYDFHERCDHQGPTLIVAESGEFLAGGFNDQDWKSVGNPRPSDKAFLFSLNKKKVYPIKKSKVDTPVFFRSNSGPTFGQQLFDLQISVYCCSTSGVSLLGNCYGNKENDDLGKELFGSESFTVSRYQVYQLIKRPKKCECNMV